MDERLRQHLDSALEHALELAQRKSETDYAALNAEMAAKGLFFSGTRLKQAVIILETNILDFSERAIEIVRNRTASGTGYEMAAAKARELLAIYHERLPKIVWHPNGDSSQKRAAGPAAMREVERLFARIGADMETQLGLASFDFETMGTIDERPDHECRESKGKESSSDGNATNAVGVSLNSDKGSLPIWLNSFQAAAWVIYRADEAAREMDHWHASAAETFYGDRPKVGSGDDLLRALQSGEIVAYGSINRQPFGKIPAVDWSNRKLTALDQNFLHPYSDIRFSMDALKKVFPTSGNAAPTTKAKLPRLGDAVLKAWWNGLDEETRNLSQEKLYVIANATFSKNHVARDRVRAFTLGRKQGPRPIGGKATAE